MLTWKKLWFRLFFLSVFLHINCLLWYPSCSCWLTSTLTSWLYCCYVVIPYHYTISYSTIVIQWYMHNMSDTQHSYQTTSYSLPPNLKRISNMIFCLSTRYNVCIHFLFWNKNTWVAVIILKGVSLYVFWCGGWRRVVFDDRLHVCWWGAW